MRDPFDAWVECACGSRHWGLGGAAGLALVHAATGTLALQLRSERSHQGGTWALPGGAVGSGESPLTGALREAQEEADIRSADVRPVAARVLDHGTWRYTTIVARTLDGAARPVLSPLDGESADLRWVPLDEVANLPLHPAFAAAWPHLRLLADAEPTLLVDAANVLGARPDGWWRDRAGATTRLLAHLDAAVTAGLPAAWFGLDATTVRPRTHVVLEGRARGASAPDGGTALALLRSPGSGDDTLTTTAHELVAAGARPLVVATADRGLRARLPVGALTLGPGTLRDAVEA